MLDPITSPRLEHSSLAHGFFTRTGGVSTGLYASLNGGTGSRDDRAAVGENRRRMAETLGVAADRLVMPYLVHSPDAVIVTGPFTDADRPRCDGLATRTPGLALGVTGADCGTVLFADPEAGVIGACHAGWKGAFTGVLASTFEDLALDTYADEARFFSYRRATHRGEADYGRLVAAISLRSTPAQAYTRTGSTMTRPRAFC